MALHRITFRERVVGHIDDETFKLTRVTKAAIGSRLRAAHRAVKKEGLRVLVPPPSKAASDTDVVQDYKRGIPFDELGFTGVSEALGRYGYIVAPVSEDDWAANEERKERIRALAQQGRREADASP